MDNCWQIQNSELLFRNSNLNRFAYLFEGPESNACCLRAQLDGIMAGLQTYSFSRHVIRKIVSRCKEASGYQIVYDFWNFEGLLLVSDTLRRVLLDRRTGCLLFALSHTTDAQFNELSCL